MLHCASLIHLVSVCLISRINAESDVIAKIYLIKLQLCSWQFYSQTMFLSTLFLFEMNRRFLEKQLEAEVKMKVSCQIAGGVGNTMQNCWQEKVKK